MSSRGCGRGRGWISQEPNPDLQKPGETALVQDCTAELIDTISCFIPTDKFLTTPNRIAELLQNVLGMISLKSVVDQLYEQALSDRAFGTNLAVLCGNEKIALIRDADEKSIKFHITQNLQHDYESRVQLRKQSTERFRNYVSFFGGMCQHNKFIPRRIAPHALFFCFEMLLESATMEDIEIVVTQFVQNHEKLTQLPEEMNSFLINVRQSLMTRNLNTTSRGMLLLILDLADRQFKSLPHDLKTFYVSQLGKSFVEKLSGVRDIYDGKN